MLFAIPLVKRLLEQNHDGATRDALMIRWITIAQFLAEHFDALRDANLFRESSGYPPFQFDRFLTASLCTLPFAPPVSGQDLECVLSLDSVLEDIRKRRTEALDRSDLPPSG